MEACITLAEQIAQRLRDSDSYRRYTAARRAVAETPGLLERIRGFKRAQLAYHAKLLEQHDLPFEEEKRISGLHANLMLNADAKAYLDSERVLLDVIRKVQDIVAESCEIDVGL
jgi:cell fate (sporulation/competence/biofilm development) regulator YlbF (YheA/YmcA/DUF963 family)